MAYIQLRTSSSQSVEFGINGMFIPFSYVTYDIEKLYAHALLNIYHGVVIGALEVGPNTPTGLNDVYDNIRLNTPNTEIIMTQDPYDALGNVVRFLSVKDDSVGRDGDVLVVTTDYKMYKRENGIYVFKFQMQGGSGGVAVSAQWFFSDFINNSLGVDGDLLLRPTGQLYKKINGAYIYQMTITGQAGQDGIDGIDGTRIFLTIDVNYAGLASENDINIVNNTEMYKYISGSWVSIGSIKGDKGLKGDQGANGDTPEFFVTSTFPNTLGKNGDIVLNPADFKIYKKITGAFVLQSTLSAPEGTVWRYNATVDNGLGKDGDFLLTPNGDVYRRNTGTYSLQVNIKGPIGDTGATGATGPSGNNGTNGINGVDGVDGNQIYFLSAINDSTGIDGDVQVVDGKFYKRASGVYVLEYDSTANSGGTGNGFIDWATISNSSEIILTTTYQLISSISITDAAPTSTIVSTAGSTTISSGGWNIDISSFGNNSVPYFIKIMIGTTTMIEKYVRCGAFDVSKYIYLTVNEPIEIYLKSNKTCSIPIEGIFLNLSKMSLLDIQKTRLVTSLIDQNQSSCSTKNITTINTSTATTLLDFSSALFYSDVIYLNILNDTTISTNDHTSDLRKAIIYITQSSATPKVVSFDFSNLMFTNSILQSNIVFSTIVGAIDMIGLEYSLIDTKWKVTSFVKGVF